jgi:hypothetical protein
MLAVAVSASCAAQTPSIAEVFIDQGRIRVEAESDPRLILNNQRGRLVLGRTWEYSIPARLQTLTIAGPRIGIVVYHMGLPVNDLRYLEREQLLDLDWRDPWNSRFRDRTMRRQYDARLNAFLYVDPHEVRVEFVVRPVDLALWTAATIPVDAQQRLKEKVAAILASSFELTVDGRPARTELDGIHFLRRRLRSSEVIDPPEPHPAASATIGAMFVVRTTGYPRQAAITWSRFDRKIQQVAAAATDESGARQTALTPGKNVLGWENRLDKMALPAPVEIGPPQQPSTILLPVIGAVCTLSLAGLLLRAVSRRRHGHPLPRNSLIAGFALLLVAAGSFTASHSSAISSQNAGKILHTLLLNIYRAFDFRDESTVYDLLARSVSGDLLRKTYLETRRALELRNQGGARVRVKQVEIRSAETLDSSNEGGFRARCTWTVSGSVGHWGHVHQRRNQYQALITVMAVDNVWKITAMELLSEERLLPELPGV